MIVGSNRELSHPMVGIMSWEDFCVTCQNWSWDIKRSMWRFLFLVKRSHRPSQLWSELKYCNGVFISRTYFNFIITHVFFWCPFLITRVSTYHANIGACIRLVFNKSSHTLRYVGLMWSFFLVGHSIWVVYGTYWSLRMDTNKICTCTDYGI